MICALVCNYRWSYSTLCKFSIGFYSWLHVYFYRQVLKIMHTQMWLPIITALFGGSRDKANVTHVTHSLSIASVCTRLQPFVWRLGQIHCLVHLIKVTVINFTPLNQTDPTLSLIAILCQKNILGFMTIMLIIRICVCHLSLKWLSSR